MLFVVALPRLPSTAAARLEALRRRHDAAGAALLPAHLTLVFGVPVAHELELRDRLASLAQSEPCLELTLDRLALHVTPGGRLLYLAVGQGAGRLRDWYEMLHEGAMAAARRRDLEIEPHITLAALGSGSDAAGAQGEASALALPLPARIEALSLLRREADRLERLGAWRLAG